MFAAPHRNRLVVLLGPRGSGKSTVGRLLAERLDTGFLDLDHEIERLAGRRIAQIFADEGEAGFRRRESAAFAAALSARPACCGVIATGGGVVLAEINRRLLLRTTATRVLLLADPTELWRRIAADPATAATRPALTDLEGEAEVRRLLKERLPLYRAVATHEIDVTTRPPDVVAAEVLKIVGPEGMAVQERE